MKLSAAVTLLTLSLAQVGYPSNHGVSLRTGCQEEEALEAFLADPVANFSRIRAERDLCRKILEADLAAAPRGLAGGRRAYIDKLFNSLYQEVDEKKIEIAIYLFLQLYRCQGSLSEKIIKIFNLRPRLFVKELEKTGEWRTVIGIVSQDWEAFSPGLSRLGASGFETDLTEYARSLHADSERRMQDIEAFLHDPVTHFERIKATEDICASIGFMSGGL